MQNRNQRFLGLIAVATLSAMTISVTASQMKSTYTFYKTMDSKSIHTKTYFSSGELQELLL